MCIIELMKGKALRKHRTQRILCQGRRRCPLCGVRLGPFGKLPLSMGSRDQRWWTILKDSSHRHTSEWVVLATWQTRRNCPCRPINVYGAAGSSGYQRCPQRKSQGASELVLFFKLQVSLLRLKFVGWLILIFRLDVFYFSSFKNPDRFFQDFFLLPTV